ncbi:hypothetical protein U1Q18_006209 [Sarracenia purpurea var. burkii]
MSGGIFHGPSQEFWKGSRGGDGAAWATYTLAVLLLLLICQLASKTRFWLGFRSSSFSVHNNRFRPVPVVSISSDCLKLKNPAISPSIHSHPRISDIISDLDLKNLIDNLDEKSHEHQKWDSVIDRQNSLLAYSAKCCKLKDTPLKYLSVTIFENCSAEVLRDFYMDNSYRQKWDKTLIEHVQLQVDESNGTEIGRSIKKFPLLTAREYILAWRVWEAKDGTFYCFSKECEHPLAPRQKYVRVKFFRSGWRIRKVPGRNACEIKMVHQEDAGLNVEMAKFAFARGIWSYVCKMDDALRKYSAANCPQSSLRATAVTLIQKVPVQLDTITNVSGSDDSETNATSSSCCQFISEGDNERRFSRRPSTKLIAKGLILLGGVLCMSRGHTLGARVAVAYILTKLTKRGDSLNKTGTA